MDELSEKEALKRGYIQGYRDALTAVAVEIQQRLERLNDLILTDNIDE